jgi:hypothetical protein
MARLYTRPTATEAKVALRRREEVASTVCPDDRRKPETLLVEALMALLNGQTQIACGCHHQDRCPMRHHAAPAQTKVVTHVHVNPEILCYPGHCLDLPFSGVRAGRSVSCAA